MNENAKKFLEAVKADQTLEEEFKKAVECLDPKARVAACIAFAQKKGFDIKLEDIIPDGQEVSLDELDNVAGGTCYCPVVGGGNGDNSDGTRYDCGCVVGGGGSGPSTRYHTNCDCEFWGDGSDK